MALNETIVDAVAGTNFKTLGDGPGFYQNMGYANAVSHQQAMNNIQLAATGRIVKYLGEMDAEEAVSVLKATTGNEVAGAITALQSALASAQQQVKTAQTTPPVTP